MEQAKSPKAGPPALSASPKLLPSPATMSAPQLPGFFKSPQAMASEKAAMSSAPLSWAALAAASRSSMTPAKFGDWTTTAETSSGILLRSVRPSGSTGSSTASKPAGRKYVFISST